MSCVTLVDYCSDASCAAGTDLADMCQHIDIKPCRTCGFLMQDNVAIDGDDVALNSAQSLKTWVKRSEDMNQVEPFLNFNVWINFLLIFAAIVILFVIGRIMVQKLWSGKWKYKLIDTDDVEKNEHNIQSVV